YVLGCDGGSSDVRHIMGTTFLGSSWTSHQWFVVDALINEDLQLKLDLGRTSIHPSSVFHPGGDAAAVSQTGVMLPQFQFICDPNRSGAQMALGNGHYRWEFVCLLDKAGKQETEEYLSHPETLCKLLATRGTPFPLCGIL